MSTSFLSLFLKFINKPATFTEMGRCCEVISPGSLSPERDAEAVEAIRMYDVHKVPYTVLDPYKHSSSMYEGMSKSCVYQQAVLGRRRRELERRSTLLVGI